MPGIISAQERSSSRAIHYILLDLSKEEGSRAYLIFQVPFGTGLILKKANLQYTPGKAHVNQKNHWANRSFLIAIHEISGLGATVRPARLA
jgi:hypothetical protein